jgi:exodeoxyribonuclease V beta subunit
LAADVVRNLSSSAAVLVRCADGSEHRERVRPRHIAVLVPTNKLAAQVDDALERAGVPAVINGAGSVFASPAAEEWLRLLEALERPSSTLRAKTAALTPFMGWGAERIATAQEEEWEAVHRRLHRWGRILRDNDVAALTEAIMIGEDLAARMLAISDGERRLTDVRHLAQLLHHAASAERLGVTALRGWLAERVADSEREDRQEERARRLESDAEAVQVLTIHRSKGLEFPVVYCPFLWDPTYIRPNEPVPFHDPATGYRYTVDVGLEGRAWNAHLRQHLVEQRGEDLRLAYVALTRAKHQAVIWWAASSGSRNSPLGRLLFAKGPDGNVAPDANFKPTDEAVKERFRELAARAPGRISVEPATLRRRAAWSPSLERPAQLRAATFDRRLDLRWRRTSYSDITAEADDALVGSEPEQPTVSDEPETPAPVGTGPSDLGPELDGESPLATMPVGVEFGTFVHTVLEATDFAAADLDAELAEQVAAPRLPRVLDLADPSELISGLRAAIDTPLGGMVNGIRLRDVGRRDRMNEVEFELPLVGGDHPTGRLALAEIDEALRAHLPAGDPMAEYAARLTDPALRSTVRGFLTGSLDLVIRLEGPRFAIADYKTNWLGTAGQPLTLGDYRPGALEVEMGRAHYGLQALLYTVALHRYLRWRMPAYEADQHLAGVLYLFLRGMAGADTPMVDGSPCGVFAWRPPGSLVESLSDVLDRGSP